MTPRFHYDGGYPWPDREGLGRLEIGPATVYPVPLDYWRTWSLYWQPRAWRLKGHVTIDARNSEGEKKHTFEIDLTSEDRAGDCYKLGFPTDSTLSYLATAESEGGGVFTLGIDFQHFAASATKPGDRGEQIIYPMILVTILGRLDGFGSGYSGPTGAAGLKSYEGRREDNEGVHLSLTVPGEKDYPVHLYIDENIVAGNARVRLSGPLALTHVPWDFIL